VSARDIVLRRIRDALREDPDVPEIPRDYRTTGHLGADAVVDLFAERVDDYRATVHRCTPDQLAHRIATALGGATSVVVPPGLDGAWLTDLGDTEVVRDDGSLSADRLDTIAAVLTAAAVGIAETGTIVLDGSDDQGRRALTLVPDVHVCVVRAEQVVQTVPQGLAATDPTRPLTLVSGPSATSDIELDRVEGVHGPRTLHVIVVAEEPTDL
jgi:L-lactate dehydrogenase complex protein LldG